MTTKGKRSTPAAPTPPRKLGEHGARLWGAIHADYGIEDAGGVEMLALACQALDRAESCRKTIDDDGEVVRTEGGPLKDHPLIKHELASRAFVARTLQRLGLDVEAIKPVGRPTGTFGRG
jgi:hypothetical protein